MLERKTAGVLKAEVERVLGADQQREILSFGRSRIVAASLVGILSAEGLDIEGSCFVEATVGIDQNQWAGESCQSAWGQKAAVVVAAVAGIQSSAAACLAEDIVAVAYAVAGDLADFDLAELDSLSIEVAKEVARSLTAED